MNFERVRLVAGLLGAPAIALAVGLAPLPSLSPEAHRLAAITSAVVVLWLTEAIPLPITALLGPALAVAAGIASAPKVFAAFGDPVIFLFIGSFLLARAMETHGVDRRLAYSLLAHPWIGGSVARMLWGLGLASAFLSMWISNTACVAMLFPVVLAIAKTTEEQLGAPAPRITTSLLLMLAYAASIGGMATPVGTPPNLIGIALVEKGAGMHIGFLTWMAIGVPITLVLFVALFAILRLFHPPEARVVPGQLEAMQQAASMLGAWSAGERNAIAAFAVAIVLWIGPGVIVGVLGSAHSVSQALTDRLPEGVAALFAASLLFVLPVDWKRRAFTLAWADAVRIDWGTILLFGGGIALGKLSFDTGLAEAIGRGLVAAFGISTPEALAGAATGTATLVSETSSNTASANMVVPVMMSMARAIGAPAAIAGVAATLGASLGFMLPISTPPNAIVYGSGRIRIGDMVKTGLVLDLVGVAVVWFAMVTLAPRVLG